MSADFFDHTFRIGEETSPYLRQGLNARTAQKIADLIRDIAAVDAVAVTDREWILGYAGDGCPYMVPGRVILTDATKQAIATGQVRVIESKAQIACPVAGCPCPLQAAVIAPLKVRGRVVGTVKLYRNSAHPIPEAVRRLAAGIAQLLSLQMEAGEAERLHDLAARARLEALQAQIRPHFLFNTLNTILMFSRTDPERARQLLVQLASFLRRALSVKDEYIRVEDELEYIHTYLDIERARFGAGLRFDIHVEPAALGRPIPVLTLQPLVENAVVHGLAPKEGGGRLWVHVGLRRQTLRVVIADDGVGMAPDLCRRVLMGGEGKGMGLALPNIHERLVRLYGPAYGLRLHSRPGRGTLARVVVPASEDTLVGVRRLALGEVH